LANILENRVITKGDILSFYAMGSRVNLVVIDFTPKSDAVRMMTKLKFFYHLKAIKSLKNLRELG